MGKKIYFYYKEFEIEFFLFEYTLHTCVYVYVHTYTCTYKGYKIKCMTVIKFNGTIFF